MGKREWKFLVELKLIKLTSVPSVNGSFFATLKNKKSKALGQSACQSVSDFLVEWNESFQFKTTIYGRQNHSLADEWVRIKISKSTRGGTVQVGHVNINLSEYANTKHRITTHILHGSDNHKRRIDNSLLHISVKLSLISGDPIFKAPNAGEDTLDFPTEEAFQFDMEEIQLQTVPARPHIAATRVEHDEYLKGFIELMKPAVEASRLSSLETV